MTTRTVPQDRIDAVHKKLSESNFLRYMAFADVILRYNETILKNDISWLKTEALMFIITRGGCLTPSKLARIMLRSNYSVTKLLNGLEKEGLITRRRSKKDRRTYPAYLTSEGLAFIEKSLEILTKGEEIINLCLSEEERHLLSELTRKLRLKLIEQVTGLKS